MAQHQLLALLDGTFATNWRLGDLRGALKRVEDLADDTEINFGYLPNFLADCYYVEEPVDVTQEPIEALLDDVQRGSNDERAAAKAEIKRRVNT